MKAMVATDQAAGAAGVKLMERPKPQAAINDVVKNWTEKLEKLGTDGTDPIS